MSRRAGMTLVEVLVAVVLCGAGLAVVASGASGAIRAEAYAGDLARAADHLELLLARLESGELELQSAEGDFAEDGAADLAWAVDVTPGDLEGLQVATVAVAWTRYGTPRELVCQRTFFVDPLSGTR